MRGVTSPVSPLGWSRGLRKSYKKRQKQKLGWFGLKYQVLFPLTEQQRKWSTEMQLNTKDFIFTKFAFTLFTKENPGLPKLRTPLKHLTGNTQLKSTNTIDNTWGERQHVIQGQKRGNMKTLKKIAQKTTHTKINLILKLTTTLFHQEKHMPAGVKNCQNCRSYCRETKVREKPSPLARRGR